MWNPPRYIPVWGTFGVTPYDACTAVAIVGGAAAFWWWSGRSRAGAVRRLAALGLAAVAAVVGGRLVHAVAWHLEQYRLHPDLWLRVYGRSIFGIFAGFAVGGWAAARVLRTPAAAVWDALSLWAMWGLAWARLGNFYTNEMLGTPTDLPWAVRFYGAPDHGLVGRHPVALYELGAAAVLLLAAWWVRRTRPPGAAAAVVLGGYGCVRMACDLVKEDAGYWGGLPVSVGQWFGVASLVAAALLWRAARSGTTGRAPLRPGSGPPG